MDASYRQLQNRFLRLQLEHYTLKANFQSYEERICIQDSEIAALKGDLVKTQRKLAAKNVKFEAHQHFEDIGRDIRMRFLTKVKKGNQQGPEREEIIHAGSRAAHRGRPIADAILCVFGYFNDKGTYRALYGIDPEDMIPRSMTPYKLGKGYCHVEQMVTITSYRASLAGDNMVTLEFARLFDGLMKEVKEYDSIEELSRAFEKNPTVRMLENRITYCFDAVIAEKQFKKRMAMTCKCGRLVLAE
jgi:hypothetical protein